MNVIFLKCNDSDGEAAAPQRSAAFLMAEGYAAETKVTDRKYRQG